MNKISCPSLHDNKQRNLITKRELYCSLFSFRLPAELLYLAARKVMKQSSRGSHILHPYHRFQQDDHRPTLDPLQNHLKPEINNGLIFNMINFPIHMSIVLNAQFM